MTHVVSTSVTFEDTLLDQDTRSMIEQSKVRTTRSTVNGALVLEYEALKIVPVPMFVPSSHRNPTHSTASKRPRSTIPFDR